MDKRVWMFLLLGLFIIPSVISTGIKIIPPVCGNEKVEGWCNNVLTRDYYDCLSLGFNWSGEQCEAGDTKSCFDVMGSGWSGNIICNDCSWDTSSCEQNYCNGGSDDCEEHCLTELNVHLDPLEDFMVVIPRLKVNKSSSYERITEPIIMLVQHHMATDVGIYGINNMHLAKGWYKIGYNYWIAKDGTIYETRGDKYKGAHTYAHNNNTLGIGYQGNFEWSDTMTDEQVESGAKLNAFLINKYNLSIGDVVGHNDLNKGTVCPGKYFRWEDLRDRIYEILYTIDVNQGSLCLSYSSSSLPDLDFQEYCKLYNQIGGDCGGAF